MQHAIAELFESLLEGIHHVFSQQEYAYAKVMVNHRHF